jgi:hypothetical protein
MISLTYNEITASVDRRRKGLAAFLVRHWVVLLLAGAGLAAAIAVIWSAVPVARLLPALSFLPCMICMRHWIRGIGKAATTTR